MQEWVGQKYRTIAQMCRDAIRKAKAQLELEAMSDVKGSQKSFCTDIISTKERQRKCGFQCSVELEN